MENLRFYRALGIGFPVLASLLSLWFLLKLFGALL